MTAILACVVLLLMVGLQFIMPYSEASPGVVGLAARRPRPVTAPPIPEYAAILRAPLFAPDRHPGESAAALPSGGGSLDGYAVLGAAVGPAIAMAVVSSPGGVPRTLRPGESLEGWRLLSVERSKVTFERNGVRRELIVGAPAESVSRAASGAAAGAPAENQ